MILKYFPEWDEEIEQNPGQWCFTGIGAAAKNGLLYSDVQGILANAGKYGLSSPPTEQGSEKVYWIAGYHGYYKTRLGMFGPHIGGSPFYIVMAVDRETNQAVPLLVDPITMTQLRIFHLDEALGPLHSRDIAIREGERGPYVTAFGDAFYMEETNPEKRAVCDLLDIFRVRSEMTLPEGDEMKVAAS